MTGPARSSLVRRIPAAAVFLLAATACGSGSTDPGDPPPGGNVSLAVVEVVSGLTAPLYLTSPPGDDRLFVVEQTGRIVIVENGQLLATPFLDLTAQVQSGGERGLLGMAFHPGYATNGRFFVSYTDGTGTSRVERYTVSADPGVADPGSAVAVLSVDQPFANHNGGQITFGPDGMLYFALGDGGSGGDPLGSGQDTGTLLGSILRLDVDGGAPYAVPADNPFVGEAGADEIWAYGLRNPWRFSFDRVAGRIYIADVGQNQWEEVSVAPADAGGLNYGWNVMEGSSCYNAASCDTSGLTLPALEYDHGQGCSITGGYVYRGDAIPEIRGHYFYSDFCTGFLRSFVWDGNGVTEETSWSVGSLGPVLSFGEDAAGELYILSGTGRVLRIVEG